MQLFHRSTSLSATFDDRNLVSLAGLVPAMLLATSTGLGELASRWLTLPGYFGANAGLKITARECSPAPTRSMTWPCSATAA